MNRTINLGGVDRQIHFGHGMILEYEDVTGRLYLDDFEELRERLNAAYKTLPNGLDKDIEEADMIRLGRKMPVSHLARFAYIGLRFAAKKSGQAIDFTQENVVDWLMLEPSKMAVVVQYFIESLAVPRDGEQEEPVPKKKARASTLPAS